MISFKIPILILIFLIIQFNFIENSVTYSIDINHNYHNKSRNHAELTLDCGSLDSCRSCTTNTNCNWCEGSSSCVLSGGDCVSCVRNNPLQCPVGDSACSDFLDCRSCSFNVNCGWCNSNNTCVGVDSYMNICLDITCPGCMIGNPLQCPMSNLSCSSFTTPRACSSQPRCGFCSSTNTCMDVNEYGDLCYGNCDGCVRVSTDDVPLGQNFCSNYTNCRDCVSQGLCSFCTSSNTCQDSNQYGDLCSDTCDGCQVLDPKQCPYALNFCSNFTTPRECASQPLCAFCTSSSTCQNVNEYTDLCGTETCVGCLIASVTSAPDGLSFCSNFTTPRSCTSQPLCGWSTQPPACVDVDVYGNACGNAEIEGCLITDPVQTPLKDQFCSNFTNCRSCSSSSPLCGWCTSSQSCVDVNEYQDICYGLCEGCLNANPLTCPFGMTSCQDYDNCRGCSENPHCGWCTSSQSCTDVNEYGQTCGGEFCDGCSYSSTSDCPKGDLECSDFTDCGACVTQPRCAFCNETLSCLDYSDGLCDPETCVNSALFTTSSSCPVNFISNN